MPKVSFDFHTAVPPERVMAMLTNFSPNRPVVWPMLAPELYEVYRLDADSAYVKEGSTFPRRIWERDDYEWSADRVRWTVQAITASPVATSKSAFVPRQAAALGCTLIGTDAELA